MLHPGHQWGETAFVMGFAGGQADRTDGAPVEGAQKADESMTFGVEARQFDGGFNTFGAGVGKEGHRRLIHRGDLTHLFPQPDLQVVVIIRRDVQELVGRVLNGLDYLGMGVAGRGDGDAGGQVDKATDVAKRLVKQLACKGVTSSPNIAKLSVSGVGLRSHTGVAIRMFRALAEAGVNVDMVSTSEVRVNVVVDGRDGDKALDSLRTAFADALG